MYLSIGLNIQDKEILLVGAGKAAQQKIENLTDYQAVITVLSKEFSFDPAGYGAKKLKKSYHKKYLKNKTIVYACTNDPALNEQIAKDCRKRNILVNVCSNPFSSDFISPALVNTQEYQVAVHSHGQDVKKTVRIRDQIKEQIHKKEILTR